MSKKYLIDFNNVKNHQDIHLIITSSLGFPDYYGCNLDALHECLTEMLVEKCYIEIRGLGKLKKFNGYDKKIYDAFLRAKHCLGKNFANNLNVTIINEDGGVYALPNELHCYNYLLDFSDAETENDFISIFTSEFGFSPEETKSFDDLWHQLLKALFIQKTVVDVRGLYNAKSDCQENIINILLGVKKAWNDKYSDRFLINFID